VRRIQATTAKVDPDFAVYIRLAAVTGARPGEICGLRWADVGWDNGEITLHRDAHLFSSSADGTAFWQPASVSRRFRTILHRHGLEHVTLYSLRHQAATVMIDAGIDAKTVSERLGNWVTTVLTTYTRARTAADRAAADLMGSIYDT